MNNPNQKLAKGIRVFFKVIFIFLIVLLVIEILTQAVVLFLDKEQTGFLPVFYSFNHPDIAININGQEIQPDLFAGLGAIVVKGVPLYLRIINTSFILLAILLLIVIIRIIQSIIKSIYNNQVFSLSNARRLKNIGIVMLVNWLMSYVIVFINILAVLPTDGPSLVPAITGSIVESSVKLIAIVFTFFMAAVFKIGVEMQEENQSFV